MHPQEMAIIRALVPVAWADGDFADKEREMIDAFLQTYGASDAEKAEVHAYAKDKRTLEDIELQELSSGDRRVLLQNAVLLSFADGHQSPAESELLVALADRLHIPSAEAKSIIADAEARARKHLNLL